MSKQSKPNQIGTRKASYTTTQQPNQQLSKPSPNALITCPTCKQPFPAKYHTCPRICPKRRTRQLFIRSITKIIILTPQVDFSPKGLVYFSQNEAQEVLLV